MTTDAEPDLSPAENPLKRAPRVLVVDDDPLTVRLATVILKDLGCDPVAFTDPLEVCRRLTTGGLEDIDCATIDYSMPGCTGLELMKKLHAVDPCLSMVILTAAEERGLVRESFRTGAVDFLQKPIRKNELAATIRKCVERTRQRRKQQETRASLEAASQASQIFRQLSDPGVAERLDTVFLPRDEIGGDFFDVSRNERGETVIVLGDVSGHDLRSALLSSYFSGFLEGLVHRDISVAEILGAFNRRLTQAAQKNDGLSTPDSIAAGFLVVAPDETSMEVIACGFPAAFVTYADGSIHETESANFPLGWFTDTAIESVHVSLLEASCVCCFTDGLQDFAAERGLDPGAVAYALLQSGQEGNNGTELVRDSSDDILLARYRFGETSADAVIHPLLSMQYAGSELGNIDELEASWRRSLGLVFGNSSPRLDDVVLCLREAVRNGLLHGCAGDPELHCTLAVTWFAGEQRLRVRISDPGPGHDFDVESRMEHLESCDENFDEPGRHLGLVLLHRMADRFQSFERGTTLVLDFQMDRVAEAAQAVAVDTETA